MPSSSVALLLHAHLPYVRHAEPVDEERWLFEAISECYAPLIRVWQRLHQDTIPARMALSVSPTLLAMLADETLRQRYLEYLAQRIELAEKLAHDPRREEPFRRVAAYHHEFFRNILTLYRDQWQCDLVSQFRALQQCGALELIASAATHALLSLDSETARIQVQLGLDAFGEAFACLPDGFWLPECAYVPGLEKLLAAHELRWFGVEAHALERGQPRAHRGPFAPVFTPSGPAAFAREQIASRQIWDGRHGYPGDAAYREFHRDVGFDLADEELPENEKGKFTGLKFHRVTDRNETKALYDPIAAAATARNHAAHWVAQRLSQLQAIEIEHCENIIFVPFDAELFGHWWFEGPIFLEHAARSAAEGGLALSTPADFLKRNSTQQIAQPAASSWGEGGFLDVWLDEKCAWLYPPLQVAQRKMQDHARTLVDDASPPQESILREMARHLLLAQASDWPFMIRAGTAADYASRRFQDHLAKFHRLSHCLHHADKPATSDFPTLFPDLNWRSFAG